MSTTSTRIQSILSWWHANVLSLAQHALRLAGDMSARTCAGALFAMLPTPIIGGLFCVRTHLLLFLLHLLIELAYSHCLH